MMNRTSLSCLVFVAAMLCWPVVPVCGQEIDEQTAIARLRSIGVEFDIADKKIVGVSFLRSNASDDDVRYLASIPSLRDINFGQRAFTDKAMVSSLRLVIIAVIRIEYS